MTSRPVALSRDLPNNRVMRAEVDGVDLAVWRNSKGELAAWNNRCPHRGMRLSHGFVRGDRLACLYHGWQYGRDGKCAYIPAHPDLDPPETIGARSYSAIENQGVIWGSVTGDAAHEVGTDGFDPVRSFNVKSSEARVKQTVVVTSLDGDNVVPVSEMLYQSGTHRFFVLLHPVNPSETLVHLLCDAATSLSERRVLSRWGEALRRNAESMEGALS
ncbi:MAG: Rieske 2Fe-2S domain-containing protein [Arenibacterium sp.]